MIPAHARLPLLIGAALLAAQAVVLWCFGQPFVAETGRLLFWVGDPYSLDNSQQFFDWYTFSHIVHGFLFYWLLRVAFPRLSISWRIVAALFIEGAWEITENTPWLINLYRQQALSVGYVGDSILNSCMDSLSMLGGFYLAWKLPTRVTIVLALLMEAYVAVTIRDNLTLNILNFIYQFDVITAWQSGGRTP